MNERNHEPDDRDPDQNLHVAPWPDVKFPLIIGGGMHDDQEESTGRLLGDVLDLVDRATADLTPDHIEERLQQVLCAASETSEDQGHDTGPHTGPGEAPLGEDSLGPAGLVCSGGAENAPATGPEPSSKRPDQADEAQVRGPEPMEMVDAARAEAGRIVAEARREAERIVAAAREQAESASADGEEGPSVASSTETETKVEAEASPRIFAGPVGCAWPAGFGAGTDSGAAPVELATSVTWALWHSYDELRGGGDSGARARARAASRRWLLQKSHRVLRGRVVSVHGTGLHMERDRVILDGLCEVLTQADEATSQRRAWVFGRAAFEACLADFRIEPHAALRRWFGAAEGLELGSGDECFVPVLSVKHWPPVLDVSRPAPGEARGARIAADVLVPYPVPTVPPEQRIDDAVERMVAADEYALPVHDGDAVIGIATMSDAVAAARRRPGDPVSSILRRPTVIGTATPIDTVRDRILTDSAGLLVVLDDSGSIAGYVTARTALAGQIEPDVNPSPQSRLVTDLYDPRVLLMR